MQMKPTTKFVWN